MQQPQTEIAKSITREQGKTLPDAEGDVLRGLQVRCLPLVLDCVVVLP
jgi:hypothetical protein